MDAGIESAIYLLRLAGTINVCKSDCQPPVIREMPYNEQDDANIKCIKYKPWIGENPRSLPSTALGAITVHLLTSKNRVAPIKPTTIPRLELSGALLGARLCAKIMSSLTVKVDRCMSWCNSTVVLRWLSSSSTNLKQFVRNRVNAIQETTSGHKWGYLPSRDNPADLVSRRVKADLIGATSLWWSGPKFLYHDESTWPIMPIQDSPSTTEIGCEGVKYPRKDVSVGKISTRQREPEGGGITFAGTTARLTHPAEHLIFWSIAPHSPYSSDLALCDFCLFSKINEKLKGKRFKNKDDALAACNCDVFEVSEKEWSQLCTAPSRTDEARGSGTRGPARPRPAAANVFPQAPSAGRRPPPLKISKPTYVYETRHRIPGETNPEQAITEIVGNAGRGSLSNCAGPGPRHRGCIVFQRAPTNRYGCTELILEDIVEVKLKIVRKFYVLHVKQDGTTDEIPYSYRIQSGRRLGPTADTRRGGARPARRPPRHLSPCELNARRSTLATLLTAVKRRLTTGRRAITESLAAD
ncbi:hypothetical protein EVAR_35969_1 [Eumeta japonica]|uniref:Uncharacterized protein n=1 Tax=Eumeta variegata TaxID=151549 RepID=A0A4C1W496_EUMVA|nr:hypothetical protein EVAR_35969_1 [Eumeta japonica]